MNKPKAWLLRFLALFLFSIAILVACQPHPTQPSPNKQVEKPLLLTKPTICKEPRSKMCTREYRPVCATKDTGIRCIKNPCPSIRQVTYSNACTACADSSVYGYRLGACP